MKLGRGLICWLWLPHKKLDPRGRCYKNQRKVSLKSYQMWNGCTQRTRTWTFWQIRMLGVASLAGQGLAPVTARNMFNGLLEQLSFYYHVVWILLLLHYIPASHLISRPPSIKTAPALCLAKSSDHCHRDDTITHHVTVWSRLFIPLKWQIFCYQGAFIVWLKAQLCFIKWQWQVGWFISRRMAALDARDGIRQWVPCYNQTTTEDNERQATTKSTSRLFSHIFSAELAHQQLVRCPWTMEHQM